MNDKYRVMAVAAALMAPAALAAPDPWGAPFTIQIGAYNAEAETKIRLDSTSGRFGTEVSFESDLGGEHRKATPTFDMLWRFNPRHAIELSAISLRRDGQTTLSATIDWGDRTFPISTQVDSNFDSDIVRLAYRWSMVHDDRAELGLLLGVHYTRLETSLSSVGSATSFSDDAAIDYPLPTIGLRGSVRLGESWRVNGFGQFLKLKIDDYDGEVLNAGVGLEWMFARSMFAGLGYEYYKYNLVSSKDNARGEFNYEFDGPRLYFGWSF
jgi:opacity protein-like surface antigen